MEFNTRDGLVFMENKKSEVCGGSEVRLITVRQDEQKNYFLTLEGVALGGNVVQLEIPRRYLTKRGLEQIFNEKGLKLYDAEVILKYI